MSKYVVRKQTNLTHFSKYLTAKTELIRILAGAKNIFCPTLESDVSDLPLFTVLNYHSLLQLKL